MKEKRVLIIEDEQLLRETLDQILEWRGFEVESAANAAEARRIVAAQTEPFDVVVLDMELKGDDVTGADLGIEFRRRYWQAWPPEFLVNSAHTKSDYLKLALELGAAAYLEKGSSDTVIQHVRALALRHGLSIERPDALETIQSMAAGSRNPGEAVLRFCKEVLARELESCLGAPFVLLVTAGRRTFGWSNTEALPTGERPEYGTVQALAHGMSKSAEPFVLDDLWIEQLTSSSAGALLELRTDLRPVLKDSVFVPLVSDSRLRLSLGILPQKDGLDPDVTGLGQALAKYFQPAVLKHQMTLTATLAEMHARQMEILKTTSQFCLWLGQEQTMTLEAAEDAGEVAEPGRYVKKMHFLSEDLCRTGELLKELAESRANWIGQEEAGEQKYLLSMRETVERAWRKISRLVGREGADVLSLGKGDCKVLGQPAYLEIATSRVLQWLAQRTVETPAGVQPCISVQFPPSGDGARIVFEDRSLRLAGHLRQFMFEPLSQPVPYPPMLEDSAGPGDHLPLYVSKTLVEIGIGGRLEDCSEHLEGGLGHRLVMSFPDAGAAWA